MQQEKGALRWYVSRRPCCYSQGAASAGAHCYALHSWVNRLHSTHRRIPRVSGFLTLHCHDVDKRQQRRQQARRRQPRSDPTTTANPPRKQPACPLAECYMGSDWGEQLRRRLRPWCLLAENLCDDMDVFGLLQLTMVASYPAESF
ncbi:unnamed protein product [Lampetra planeri]